MNKLDNPLTNRDLFLKGGYNPPEFLWNSIFKKITSGQYKPENGHTAVDYTSKTGKKVYFLRCEAEYLTFRYKDTAGKYNIFTYHENFIIDCAIESWEELTKIEKAVLS